MLEPEIIYETENFLAVNKPAGLMVHQARHSLPITGRVSKNLNGDARTVKPRPTLVDWLVKRYPELRAVGDKPELRPGIVHRLDKDTSGVMLVPRNQNYFVYLKSLFQKHEVKKMYYAIVSGALKNKEGIIDAPIGIRSGTLKRSVRSMKMQKTAVTEYKVIKQFGTRHSPREKLNDFPNGETQVAKPESYALLEVRPQTGRTHQIRVHLASIGHPVIGDKLYGTKKFLDHRLLLHAATIEFREKNGSIIRIESELPEEFLTFH